MVKWILNSYWIYISQIISNGTVKVKLKIKIKFLNFVDLKWIVISEYNRFLWLLYYFNDISLSKLLDKMIINIILN